MNTLILCSFTHRMLYKSENLVWAQLNECKRYLFVSHSCASKDKTDVMTMQTEDDVNTKDNELKIELIRNKSRLRTDHRNQLFGKKPFSEPLYEFQYSVKYNRSMFGKYGLASGVNPGISWPTKVDLSNRQEYEKVAFPFTIQESVESAKKELEMQEITTQKYQNGIMENLAKLDKWKKDLRDKISKREADGLAAKQKKERLIEEVRRHFGFTVDPKDERFKEMVAAKEKEQKKKEKLAKIEEREKKAIAKLMSHHETIVSDSSKVNNK